MSKKLTLGVLITTMNDGIERVKRELLPQLDEVDEIIISHQITDPTIQPDTGAWGEKVTYLYMYDKGLSKNRNNALKHSKSDICHICDDDLDYIAGFTDTIKEAYSESQSDVITFQALDEFGKRHYPVKSGKHSLFSIGKVGSAGITFKRETSINFDEHFGLGAINPTGEENIFLRDCQKQGLILYHSNDPIVIHPKETSSIQYNDALIKARTHVFHRMYGPIGAIASIFYFTVQHYKFYKGRYSIGKFILLSMYGFLSPGNDNQELPIIIEFIGLQGAGKSTLLNKLEEQGFLKNQVTYIGEIFHKKHYLSKGIIYKIITRFKGFIKNLSTHFSILAFSLKTKRPAVIFNILSYGIRLSQKKYNHNIIISDEIFLHHLGTSYTNIPENILTKIPNIYPIYFALSYETHIKRTLKRNKEGYYYDRLSDQEKREHVKNRGYLPNEIVKRYCKATNKTFIQIDAEQDIDLMYKEIMQHIINIESKI